MQTNFQKFGSSLGLAHDTEHESKKEGSKKQKLAVKALDKIITLSIFMWFFGVPLFFTGLTFQGIIFEKQVFFYFWILIALIAWAGKGVVDGEMKIRRTPLDIPIGLFWLTYLLATIFSVDRWHSFIGLFGDPSRGLMNVTALVLAYYIMMSNFSEKTLRWIVGAVVSSGIIIAAWSSLGVMGIKFLPSSVADYAPLSLIGSFTGLGLFLAIIMPILITAIFKLQSAEKMSIWTKRSLTGILLAGLALDIFLFLVLYGFVPWIAFMVGIGFFLIFILSRVIRPVENWTWLAMVVFVVLMIIWMSGGSSIGKVSLPVEVSPTYGLSWEIAKESLKSNFFIGSGAASYGYDFSLYKPQNFNLEQLYNLRFYQATGAIFEAISTIGALGTIALILLLLSFVSVSIFLLVIKKERDKVYSLGFMTAAFIFLIASILGRVEGTIMIFGALISAIALAIVMKESDSDESFLRLSLKASPKYALALAFVFMVVSAGVAYLFVFVGKIYAADFYAGISARQEQVTEEGSISKMGQAIDLNRRESRYYINFGQQYMVMANREMIKPENERDINLIQGYLNNSIGAVSQGKKLSPNDVSAVESLAGIYEIAGMYAADSLKLAEDNYREALELEPNSPELVLALGKIKLSQAMAAKTEDERNQLGNESKDLFNESIEKKENFAAGYYHLAVAQSMTGEVDQAIESMKKAVELNSNSIDYNFNLARLYQQRGEGDDDKTAEQYFQKILKVNDKEINTHFSLAGLYEKMGDKEKAIKEYERVLELLPAEDEETAEKIREMIANVRSGAGNLNSNATGQEIVQPEALPEQPSESQPIQQLTE